MRKKRTLLVLILAIVSGSLAGYSALRYLQDRSTPLLIASPPEKTQSVVVATRDLPLGSTLTENDVQVVAWPASATPVGYATSVAEVVGRSLITDITLNEPVLAAKLADTGLHGMIPLIEPGMRALSVKVDEVVGVAGFVTPGTRVDVILIMQPPGERESTGKVILQNIQALAANQQITEGENGQPIVSTVVTVLVAPDQAEKLALAATKGRIQMALRHTLDLESIQTEGERESRLFRTETGGTPRPAARVGTTSRATSESIIEMYRGGARTLITYR